MSEYKEIKICGFRVSAIERVINDSDYVPFGNMRKCLTGCLGYETKCNGYCGTNDVPQMVQIYMELLRLEHDPRKVAVKPKVKRYQTA